MPLAGLHAGEEALQGAVHAGGAHAPAHGREAAQVHGECALARPPRAAQGSPAALGQAEPRVGLFSLLLPWALCLSQSLRLLASCPPEFWLSLRVCAAVGVCQHLCGYVRVTSNLPHSCTPLLVSG